MARGWERYETDGHWSINNWFDTDTIAIFSLGDACFGVPWLLFDQGWSFWSASVSLLDYALSISVPTTDNVLGCLTRLRGAGSFVYPITKQISFYPHISHIFRIIEAAISYQGTHPRDKSCRCHHSTRPNLTLFLYVTQM